MQTTDSTKKRIGEMSLLCLCDVQFPDVDLRIDDSRFKKCFLSFRGRGRRLSVTMERIEATEKDDSRFKKCFLSFRGRGRRLSVTMERIEATEKDDSRFKK
jgi:hypothetical protein